MKDFTLLCIGNEEDNITLTCTLSEDYPQTRQGLQTFQTVLSESIILYSVQPSIDLYGLMPEMTTLSPLARYSKN